MRSARHPRLFAVLSAATLLAGSTPARAGIFDGPPILPDPAFTRGTIQGAIRLAPAGHDFRWCNALEVTATLQWIATRTVCQGQGLTRTCWQQDVVTDQQKRTVDAQPTANDRSAWSYSLDVPAADRVKLKAACAPAYDYKYAVRPGAAWKQGFPIQALQTLDRPFRLRLTVPPPSEQTVALAPAHECTNMSIGLADGFASYGWCFLGGQANQTVAGFEADTGRETTAAYEALVDFDLSPIEQIAKKVVLDATLTYAETVVAARDASGAPRDATSCAEHLAAPTLDWTLGYPDHRTYVALIAAEPLGDELRIYAGQRWNVVQQVTRWLAGLDENRGFVLKGDDEHFPDNDSACRSLLSDFQLTVHFLALPDVPEETIAWPKALERPDDG